jgi:hypothetical protein
MQNAPFKNYLWVGVILNLVALAFVLLVQGRLPPQVPLFYGLPQGEEQLTKPIFLVLPALISLAIISINFLSSRFIKDDFLKKVLVVVGLATAVFAGITTFRIILLVGNF